MENKKTEFIQLYVTNENGERVEKTVQAPRIEFTFSEHQDYKLRNFWKDIGGLEHLTEGFVRELRYYMDTTPALITDKNTRVEYEQRDDYKNVADICKQLTKALTKMQATDRINLLSLRNENRIPMCDPMDYVKTIQELAEFTVGEFDGVKKYDCQINNLTNFINRFPPCKKLIKKQFTDLFYILYCPETDDGDELDGVKFKFMDSIRKPIKRVWKK